MCSLITAVFKATIGLLVKIGRNKAAERLKEGDVTDETFRGLIVREIDEIRSRLDGLARKDLIASISFFKEGIELLYEVFDKASPRSEHDSMTAQAAAETASSEAFSLAKRRRRLQLIHLDESSTRVLSNAKDRFKDARREATKAFANEALGLFDRVLAMQYRVMATILETVDNPTDALAPCRVCIKELHCLSAVKECFAVEVNKGLRARFGKDERRTIISTVCQVNRTIYDVTLMVCFGDKEILTNWPCVDAGEKKIDPLRDEEITKVLKNQGMERCVPWSFGEDGEEENKLQKAVGIATNTLGQFLVADRGDQTLKVFDSNGNFLLRVNFKTDDVDTLIVRDIATDVENNIYVLISNKKPGAEEYEREVQAFNKTADPHVSFPVTRGKWGRLTVSGSKVLVLGGCREVVDVYEQDGGFVCSFGEGIFTRQTDIDAADDRVIVVDRFTDVYFFTVEGQQLSRCTVHVHANYIPLNIACHPAGGHVIVACKRQGGTVGLLMLEIHTDNGEFVRRIQLDELVLTIFRVRVTMEGLIAITFDVGHDTYKAIVV